MLWRRLDTAPIEIDTGVEPAIAHAVAGALAVHAPALDGASGATLWALRTVAADGRYVLQPAAVQSAFKHDAYMRGTPFGALRQLLRATP
jgi:hypothetical protein